MGLTAHLYGGSVDARAGIGWVSLSREGCRVRSLRLALGSLLAAAALVAVPGCGGDPSAEPRASASNPGASSAPTRSVTVSLKPKTPIGFVRAWVDAENVAINSGDIRPLLGFEAPSCFNCKQLLKPITRIYGAGGFIHSKGWRVERPNVVDTGGGDVLVTMLIITSVEVVKPSHDSPIQHHKPDKLGFSVTLSPEAEAWRITQILIDS
jgi:hypothetical protein